MPDLVRKTWGAELTSDDVAHFRLWAPDEQAVRLVLADVPHSMRALDSGWFEVSARARVGDRYWFELSDGTRVADPASRAQPEGVSGPSMLVDRSAYQWKASSWRGRPWEESIISELHVGCFTPEGTFRAAAERLPHLAQAGITAIEIMPVAEFQGERGWGYDGVLPYAPHHAYGTPDDLKALVDAAHGLGMMVLLDVVYNHFGPEGNSLPRYASRFFNGDRPTPWGASIAFEEPAVRRFFIDNALYWLGDFRFDGLRLDATDQIRDTSEPHFLAALAREVHETFADRNVHLVVEDADRRRNLVRRNEDGTIALFTAGWNDDFHHGLHVIATGEERGFYRPFATRRWQATREAMTDGFASTEAAKSARQQDDPVPPQARVSFLQNHDQIGNRAFGERLVSLATPDQLRVMTAMLMLSPQIPLFFMGEEYGESQPFLFFAHYAGELGEAVRRGRHGEAENFGGMPPGKTADDLPDPIDPQTFAASKLRWERAASASGRTHVAFMRHLADIRQRHIAPLMRQCKLPNFKLHPAPDGIVAIDWSFGGPLLELRTNLTSGKSPVPPIRGEPIFGGETLDGRELPGPSIVAAVRSN
ncbi:malto-oligosyltrehalose trehalohydrolase TreZ (plasmid) [Sinorhizobium americanum CCGM7]|uniref:malto-oligosyltrehalose trehalohydrolase n=1 Tax=Sinorhizobium americanum TaxID=194963 RepID=UPI0004D675EF|nr:malto-oligosyltrehalose trehalohydrolase [Sinorhizobium americanum]APG88766.1 malto-oligosyltrehalose trehalohydrolase TreZ [Sinorhizobium americanum CCGM7]